MAASCNPTNKMADKGATEYELKRALQNGSRIDPYYVQHILYIIYILYKVYSAT